LNYLLAPCPLWPLRVPSDVCYWPDEANRKMPQRSEVTGITG
jgi:hypothetical protein